MGCLRADQLARRPPNSYEMARSAHAYAALADRACYAGQVRISCACRDRFALTQSRRRVSGGVRRCSGPAGRVLCRGGPRARGSRGDRQRHLHRVRDPLPKRREHGAALQVLARERPVIREELSKARREHVAPIERALSCKRDRVSTRCSTRGHRSRGTRPTNATQRILAGALRAEAARSS